MYIKIELESVGTWWRQNAAIEVNPLVWMVIPVSDDKSIIKQVLPKRSVSTRLADDHDSLAPQNVSLIKKMTLYHSKWLWNSVHYKLISNYGSENEVYHIFSALPSLRRFTESVVICLKRMLRRARSFHCFLELGDILHVWHTCLTTIHSASVYTLPPFVLHPSNDSIK